MRTFAMLALKEDGIKVRLEEYSPEKLKELMRELKMTYDELSLKSLVPVPTLKKWAKGLIRPSIDNVGKLGKAMNIFFIAPWPKNEESPDSKESGEDT